VGKVYKKTLGQESSFYYDLYEPRGTGPKPLLIALHGYGGNKESMMRFARSVNDKDYVIASPNFHCLKYVSPWN